MEISGFDIIGDVHGCYTKLSALLKKMGYKYENSCFRHRNRKVIFAGDIIDGGNEQKKTIDLVHRMHKENQALVILGNHELNGISWTIKNKKNNKFLREHNKVNYLQHYKFLKEFQPFSKEHFNVIEWFKTLPIALEFDDFRVIHACWDKKSLQEIPKIVENKYFLQDEDYYLSHTIYKKSIDNLTKGIKYKLPQGLYFLDAYGHKRYLKRILWWKPIVKNSILEQFPQIKIEGNKKNLELLKDIKNLDFSTSFDKLVFFGHYWEKGIPRIENDKAICLDYSVLSKDGFLTAYRFNGDSKVNEKNFCYL